MRDYKKGKFLLESRPGQLLPVSAAKDSRNAAVVEKQQKRILDKVWGTVEKTMTELRSVLLHQLQDPNRPVEEQEKTLEFVHKVFFRHTTYLRHFRILLELNMPDDPVWSYFDAQHSYILEQMRKVFSISVVTIQGTFLAF
jgi:exocyst complex component 2